jgi:hypothetical protein
VRIHHTIGEASLRDFQSGVTLRGPVPRLLSEEVKDGTVGP